MPSRIKPAQRLSVAAPPDTPILLWDRDCNFCHKWIARWRRATGDRVEYATSAEGGGRFPEIPAEAFVRSVQLVETDGGVSEGAEAVFRALAHAPGCGAPLWMWSHIPGGRSVAEVCYRFVARRRKLFSTITQALWGADVTPPGYNTASRVFVRVLAATYLIAFASLLVQVQGLAGSRGILPLAPFLEAVRDRFGAAAYTLCPTVFWLGAGDGALNLVCGAGAALAAILMLTSFAPALTLLILWALYLSVTTATRTFLGFQWDNLLLEAGFIAIFLGPLRLRPWRREGAPAAKGAVRLLQWLLFRLMFTSGVVKLAAHTPAWRDLTAMDVHYETQPLPTWTAWYMHQLPHICQAASEIVMLVVELGAPLMIFAPRRLRHGGAAALIALQIVILATGNYAFFNLLSIALCLLLLDDTVWPARWRRAPTEPAQRVQEVWPSRSRRLLIPFGLLLFLLGTIEMTDRMRIDLPWPSPLRAVQDKIEPFRSVNSYGLFADMTTFRHEIIVQGSNDGMTWLDYEFRWKPGDPGRRPLFVAPHQPRLDWQMWFAALGTYQRNPWFAVFLRRLLEGSPDVVALLERNPFPDAPPRQIRAVLYDYHFTDFAGRSKEHFWWRREYLGPYSPTISAGPPQMKAQE